MAEKLKTENKKLNRRSAEAAIAETKFFHIVRRISFFNLFSFNLPVIVMNILTGNIYKTQTAKQKCDDQKQLMLGRRNQFIRRHNFEISPV